MSVGDATVLDELVRDVLGDVARIREANPRRRSTCRRIQSRQRRYSDDLAVEIYECASRVTGLMAALV